MSDYNATSHEFGHFLDGYINYGKESSLATMEISSQAMELLTLLKLKGVLHTPEYKYLTYVTMNSYLVEVLLAQSFFAAFEHAVYALEYDEINATSIREAMLEAHSLVYSEGDVHPL